MGAGVATNYVDSSRLAEVRDAVLERGTSVLAELAPAPSSDSIAELRERVDATFKFDTVEEIRDALALRNDEWSAETLKALDKVSPSSLKITLRMLRAPDAPATLEEAFALEHQLGCRVLKRPDFFEGVRSVLVDKDHSPKWLPPTLAEVDSDFYFEKNPNDDKYDVTKHD